MSAVYLKASLVMAVILLVLNYGQGQQPNSVTVPTPSFSNPGSSATTTQVPATGVTLNPANKVKLPGLDPLETIAEKPAEPAPVSPTVPESTNPTEEETGPAEVVSHQTKSQGVRVEMLEKIGDQLSLRMRAVRDREESLLQRERSMIEREERAAEREKMIRQIEETLLEREEMVRRREKLPPPQVWRGSPAPQINAQYAAVLDGKTMQFFHTKNATEQTPVASTQKLMTALVICDSGSLDEMVAIPRAATLVEPTHVGVKAGEKYTRRELLTGLLVKSGNDLAAALAIDNAGSIDEFSVKMNLMGKRIGLINSNFKSPHGLPVPGQYSCARDIGIVAFEAYQNPEIRDIIKKKAYDFRFNDGQTLLLSNTNRLLREWDLCNGMKTGFTYAAGKCLVASASVNGEHRISVIIKDSNEGVWADSKRLLTWALGLELLGPMAGYES
jgi:serine-type D-Ala-D-Ala carboxypeptidase (penicillin-binding protein 5/6)